ncbi:peptidoglycan DD-metalloendopeptidase family protein [Massilia sp. IC2-477]|uniref:peptidoglycan DD-metalloendopeptidase family protein n=1 Tax=Massilia sp. IC2-477 TaxID=2887198 RepID=UPI001D111F1C|nr:peptidoglycan DD-metalloendopeptidase family protein [Massilia sp. IC2-477]MCC2955875.1 peptidoglycan DD-metalloendopeptidase family protein [Massilia sp. IC2-477]
MNQAPHLPRLALLTLALGLLAGCNSLTRQAPVVERTTLPTVERPRPTAAARVEEPEKKDEKGMYTVRRGDTLLRIALDHGQNYRDLVAWNNLRDPDDIKVGQTLRVAAPERGERTANMQTQPVPMPPPAATPPRKTTPRADKQPYNENVASQEAGVRPDAPRPAAPAPVAAPAPSAPAPAPAVAAAANDEDNKLSWMWPADGRVVATFDERNKGIDIAGRPGQQVVAAGAGKVMYAGSGIRGYGNLVIVKHNNSLLSAYAHNRKIVVKEGDNVAKGQMIAEMGDSDADSVKLHFEIRQQGKPVDPSRFLPGR